MKPNKGVSVYLYKVNFHGMIESIASQEFDIWIIARDFIIDYNKKFNKKHTRLAGGEVELLSIKTNKKNENCWEGKATHRDHYNKVTMNIPVLVKRMRT
jgi:hypothetical protein